MLRVSCVPAAVQAVSFGGVRELLLQLPGDLSGSHAAQIIRNQVWCQVQRRGGGPVSTTVATRDAVSTVFLVRRCLPAKRLSASEQAEVFLAVTVGGMTRREASAKFGLASSSVSALVRRIKGLARGSGHVGEISRRSR